MVGLKQAQVTANCEMEIWLVWLQEFESLGLHPTVRLLWFYITVTTSEAAFTRQGGRPFFYLTF